jgi:uncharacterized protein involved in outer membrane biogenesis
MKRFFLWATIILASLVLLVLAAAYGLRHWIGTEDFRTRVQAQASAALGVPVKLDGLDVSVWPLPAVVVLGAEVQTRPMLALERLEVRPALTGLMAGRLEVATVLVRKATIPQTALEGLAALLQKKERSTQSGKGPEGETASKMSLIPQNVVLDDVTWVNAKGAASTINAKAGLGSDGFPDDVSVDVVKGQFHGTKARVERGSDGWNVVINLGGGTIKGPIQLTPAAQVGAPFSLKGQLETRDVEMAALLATASGVSPLSGRLEASTTLFAKAVNLAALADAVQTQSKFTVQDAVVRGIDLAKAVQTVGLNRGGETRLDTLAGQVNTQGRAAQLVNLVASSGVLSATGNVNVSPNKALSGRVNVNLAAGALGKSMSQAVGVPLVVGGTLDAPEVTLTRAALIGAAIGTAIMPGVGTGAGASMGDKVENSFKKLFGK